MVPAATDGGPPRTLSADIMVELLAAIEGGPPRTVSAGFAPLGTNTARMAAMISATLMRQDTPLMVIPPKWEVSVSYRVAVLAATKQTRFAAILPPRTPDSGG